MIITAGSLKFKKIESNANNSLRPTSNKVRQAVFNILNHKLGMENSISTACILDAFAGTGIIGFEAISRGAVQATFIEKDIKNFKTILQNIKRLKIHEKTNSINDDFFNIKSLPFKYKLVYLDPPYKKNLINLAIEKILDTKILKKKSIVICETEKNFIFDNSKKKFLSFYKTYGSVKLTFLEYD